MNILFVSALPFRTDEETLRNIFSVSGQVGGVKLFADWENPTYEPYALVEVSNVDDAIKKLDGLKIGYTHLRVHEWQGKKENPAHPNLFETTVDQKQSNDNWGERDAD